LILLVLAVVAVAARQSNSAQAALASGSATSTQANHASSPDFITAADQVLLQMSQILSLPIKQPLKKSATISFAKTKQTRTTLNATPMRKR
jgi:hypothetical protein